MRRTRRGGSRGSGAPPASGSAVGTIDPSAADLQGEPDGRSRRRYDPAWDDWKRPRRWPGVLASCLVVLAFLGVVIWHYRPQSHPHKVVLPTAGIAQPAFAPGATGTGAVVTAFHGTGNASGLSFFTSGNLLLLHARCFCQYNFVVTIVNQFGTLVSFPVSVSGRYDGTVALPLYRGRYSMKVVGSGPWTLQVIQPGPTIPALATPFSYFSLGPSVVGPFSSANKFLALKFLSFTNGNIYVHVLDLDGRTFQTPFTARNSAELTQLLPGAPNPYYLFLDANGYWKLVVRRSSS